MIEAIGSTMMLAGGCGMLYYAIHAIDELNRRRERLYNVIAVICCLIAFGGLFVFQHGYSNKRLDQEVKEIRQEMEQTVDAITEGM